AGTVLSALVDAHAAGSKPPIESFELGDAVADLVLRPFRAFGVMECDLQRHLHGHSPRVNPTPRHKRSSGRSVRGAIRERGPFMSAFVAQSARHRESTFCTGAHRGSGSDTRAPAHARR